MESPPVFLYILLALFSIMLMIVVIREFFMKPKSKDQQVGKGKIEAPTEQGVQSPNITADTPSPIVEEVPSPTPKDLDVNEEFTDTPSEEN